MLAFAHFTNPLSVLIPVALILTPVFVLIAAAWGDMNDRLKNYARELDEPRENVARALAARPYKPGTVR